MQEPGDFSTDFAAEVISENTSPSVHQDISAAQSSVEPDSPSCSSDNDFSSPSTGRYPKDGKDGVVFQDREDVSKHLDFLAEAYGYRFSEKTIREEVDEIADIDEGLLLELEEVGDFSVKEVGEPVLEKKVLPEEAQEERFELGSNSNSTEAKSDIPILEARTLADINLAFRQLQEGVDVEDVILLSAIESQVNEDAKPETSSDLEVVEARSLGDIHDAVLHALESNIDELGSSSNSSETKSDIPMLEAKSLDDINFAFRQLHDGVDVEDVIEVNSQVTVKAKPETSSDLEVVEARSLGDIHVALMQLSEKNIDESGSSSNPTETKSDIPILEARSLDDINLAFKQLHEGVDVEDVILPSAIKSQVEEGAKTETNSDLEVVEAKSLGDIHVALMQSSEKNLNELPESSVSNVPSEGLEPAGVDSIIETASSNATNADKAEANTVDEKSVDPNVSASKNKDKKEKSGKSSGSSSSSSSSDSD